MRVRTPKLWMTVWLLFLLGCESPPIETEQKMTPKSSVQVVGRKDLKVAQDPVRIVAGRYPRYSTSDDRGVQRRCSGA